MYVLLSPCALFPDDELGSPSTSTVGKTEEKDSSDVDQSFVSDERSEAAEVPSEREEARSEEPSEAATTAAATATATATDEQHPEPAKASYLQYSISELCYVLITNLGTTVDELKDVGVKLVTVSKPNVVFPPEMCTLFGWR
ncbi:unnamed protein product [Heligmosomoides polygyrus]|uniref:BRCT domain-containing protein n=1 Tax=Heligmosomoides polygyrus TaxID=6339 RepID=A0A183FIX6_HELPZ|nr:unnamed protein product [Heligmosomoides polygyrus]